MQQDGIFESEHLHHEKNYCINRNEHSNKHGRWSSSSAYLINCDEFGATANMEFAVKSLQII
jgi:hypothetical protein